ncbi:Hypothetical protein, putative [Bodo saltans]|uniref:Uncharacterized protein n=1 Tax=Bodo saltans TaxID=75058 RepID=A0A0S4IQG8_BODSA|nr:Hypothetical protein, putative [Bodo saltans]|eukprot:CUF16022.1 Hypothetical protein, putative [Bodo saltans]
MTSCSRGLFNDTFGFIRFAAGVRHHSAVRSLQVYGGESSSWTSSPAAMSVSANSTSTTVEGDQKSTTLIGGEHVALWYAGVATCSQYVFISRCETLSPLWIAKLPLNSLTVTALALIDAHTLAIVASDGNLYLATLTAQQEHNKKSSKGKHFRVVDAIKHAAASQVVAIAAVLGSTSPSLVVVTRKEVLVIGSAAEPQCRARVALPSPLAKEVVSPAAAVVHVVNNAEGVVVVQVVGSDKLYIAQLNKSEGSDELSSLQEVVLGFRSAKSTPVPLLGPFGTIGVAVTKDAAHDGVVFITIVKSEGNVPAATAGAAKGSKKGAATSAFEAVVLAPVSLPQGRTLSGWSSASSATATSKPRRSASKSASTEDSIALFTTTSAATSSSSSSPHNTELEVSLFSLGNEGLPTQQSIDAALSQYVASSTTVLVPSTSNLLSSSSVGEEGAQEEENAVSTPSSPFVQKGSSTAETSATFVYAAKLADDIVLFRVSARSFALHTKLSSQWVEGGERLTQLLRSTSSNTTTTSQLLEHRFHPSHLRLALRRLTGKELVSLFVAVVESLALSTSRSKFLSSNGNNNNSSVSSSSSTMLAASPNGCDVALQIVTLHRQLGLELPVEDVSKLVEFLQECRRMGHHVGGAATRLQTMLAAVTAASALSARRGAGSSALQLDSAWGKDASGSRGVQVRYTTRPASSSSSSAGVAAAAAELLRKALSQTKLQELQAKVAASAANAASTGMFALTAYE